MADRVGERATDLQDQLNDKWKDFVAYSLAVDESTDATDTAQLSVFIRGVDSKLSVMEELLDVKSMHDTATREDFVYEVEKFVNDMKLPWHKLMGKMREKMRNCPGQLTAYHCIIHQEMLFSKVLNMDHVMSTLTRTMNFIRARGLNYSFSQCNRATWATFHPAKQSQKSSLPLLVRVHFLPRN